MTKDTARMEFTKVFKKDKEWLDIYMIKNGIKTRGQLIPIIIQLLKERKQSMNKNEEIYIVTDGCMWEQNKQNETYHPHAIEVLNIKTGQIRYIKSGSRIVFIEGEISEGRNQEAYNKVPVLSEVSDTNENKLQRGDGKEGSNKDVKGKVNKTKRIQM